MIFVAFSVCLTGGIYYVYVVQTNGGKSAAGFPHIAFGDPPAAGSGNWLRSSAKRPSS